MRHLHLQRDGKTILRDISMTLGSGEIVTLIGPNGAGKTTLVKIALGLLTADSGSVTRRAGLTVGYVPQRIQFDPTLPLTVARFLRLERRTTREPTGKPTLMRTLNRLRHRNTADQNGTADDADLATTPTTIDHALTQAGAAGLADAPLQSISGGELRRVLLARALLRDPDLLILDEPAAGMDIHGQADLYRLIHAIRERRRCTIVLVSHDLYMVMAATDRVFCLNRHLCCSGQPEDVRRHPEFLALFGARAAAELAVYHHHHDHRHNLHGDIQTR